MSQQAVESSVQDLSISLMLEYCTICKGYFKEEHDDLWDCIVVYEKKKNEVSNTIKNYISNLQKKEKVKYESAFSKWSIDYK